MSDIKLIHCEEAVTRAKINKKITFKINLIFEIRNVAKLPVEGAQYYIEPWFQLLKKFWYIANVNQM